MAQANNDALPNIRQYADQARGLRESSMGVDASSTDVEARLDHTLRELQTRVKDQQAALDDLRAERRGTIATVPSGDRKERLKQLNTLRDGYRSITQTDPFLPSKQSVLPALLAARHLQETVNGSKAAISATQQQIKEAEASLQREQANLYDANLLSTAMENRIERLQNLQIAKTQKSASQLANETIRAKQEKKANYVEVVNKLDAAFDSFVNDHLAAMLAAEELGGPVVGNMMDIEDATIAAGFTRQGKVKSTKKLPSDSKRQKRIDEIWGDKAVTEEGEQLDEIEAASMEFKELVQVLFNTLTRPGGSGQYVELDRESAASRFLVRAKIAQFHPKDARKLRLIDFGRELDD